MASARVTTAVVDGDTSFSTSTTTTVTTVVTMEETVGPSVTDQAHVVGIDISELDVFYMVADGALTVQTNDGTTPADTFTLVANQPVIFLNGGTNPFSADVTALYLTNASSTATVTFKLYAGQTP